MTQKYKLQIASGRALAQLLEISPDLQQYIGDDPQQLQQVYFHSFIDLM